MKKGSPNFIGDNLKEIREARALNQTSLGKIIGVSRQAISQYEKNLKTPSYDVLLKLSYALSIPLLFFSQRRNNKKGNSVVFFRSLSSATKMSRRQSERKLFWVIDCMEYLRKFIEFPNVTYPSFDIPDDPANLSFDDIEQIAMKVRDYWGLSNRPISNIVWLLENNGGVVCKQETGDKRLDAFSQWYSRRDTPYYVLIKDKASAVRLRFDAAHELGHIILHRNITQKLFNNQKMFRLIEKQANYFAAAFLLPEDSFSSDVIDPSLNLLRSLKPKWKVSIAAMIMRLRNLKIISEERESNLFINLSRRGWRTKEPLDDEIESEQPRLIEKAFRLLFESGIVNNDDLINNLGIHLNELESIVGLHNFFECKKNIIQFPNMHINKNE